MEHKTNNNSCNEPSLDSQVAKLPKAEDVEALRESSGNMDISKETTPGDAIEESGRNPTQTSIQITKELLRRLHEELCEISMSGLDPDSKKDLIIKNINKLNRRMTLLTRQSDNQGEVDQNSAGVEETIASEPKIVANFTYSLRDVPRFQLTTMYKVYFPNEPMYDNVWQFTTAYEIFMNIIGLDCEKDWKRFIPVAFHPSFMYWVKEKLIAAPTWPEARELIEKRLDINFSRSKARMNVLGMRIGSNESVEDYSMRFLEAAYMARMDTKDYALGEIFMCGLPSSWYNILYDNLDSNPETSSFLKTVEDVTEAAKDITIDRFDSYGKRKFSGEPE
ncbi:hypothetical protein J3Q64DRAFT_1859107 [Phycomyces blakesleeanus]|uniref:Retrotransposon gag domain-containing protein n=2 Tax=Phycomyces blakesleeanus TaxID=4837 RepID=A0A167QJB5_PHYB8|nr:hypothetical protein PHYBLDRAFT_162845 [Phycomyces blakesleeanus NRRL 1555(-)]OAD79787.1 hypothetical protein PHYBLDRAFT_162845 [Phycomyces blakesleeanus NRRL 1555(-)]|eukprot:XP_018297827.1 hypothetical protein PHYBLDRAFT_162845 [Phycomyces blakesleeanus NRRL 1555(-)]